MDGSSFTIPRVNRLHMGAYLCIASNGVPPTVSKRVMLIVHCNIQHVFCAHLRCLLNFFFSVIKVPPMIWVQVNFLFSILTEHDFALIINQI